MRPAASSSSSSALLRKPLLIPGAQSAVIRGTGRDAGPTAKHTSALSAPDTSLHWVYLSGCESLVCPEATLHPGLYARHSESACSVTG